MTHVTRWRQLRTNLNLASLSWSISKITREYQCDSPSLFARFLGMGLSRDGPVKMAKRKDQIDNILPALDWLIHIRFEAGLRLRLDHGDHHAV